MRKIPMKPRGLVAALLAVLVHAGLLLFLVFGVQWQNRVSAPTMVEIVPPMPAAKSAPPPEPPPPIVPQPTAPPPPPPPVQADTKPVARPEPASPDIALNARRQKERLERERVERERLERQKRERELRDLAKKEAEKRDRETREAAKREADLRSLEELKLAQDRARQEAEVRQRREAQAQREREQRERLAAQQAAATAAADKAQADYVNRIQAKIRGNVIMPPDIAGNPEAIFDVVQLPTGEIISAEIRKSSGSRAYDDAVLRAILKSSPLPKPASPVQVQRELKLTFRPRE